MLVWSLLGDGHESLTPPRNTDFTPLESVSLSGFISFADWKKKNKTTWIHSGKVVGSIPRLLPHEGRTCYSKIMITTKSVH